MIEKRAKVAALENISKELKKFREILNEWYNLKKIEHDIKMRKK